ncbi:GPW/gp25 family protein [Anthocerotibacter panamensis]|uniref:GPW/gp25 family protein n=1 Tax=Anthocerotibacter panamensis TaxID=2857077 RepID=UPI001C402B5A|nr:GPW/gp25 family protein [Anthocerotibacter panamensis]
MAELVRGKQPAFLGNGWSFPLQINVQGGIQLSPGAQDIEESIRIILRTSLRERVYRPNFGSRLSELAFAPLNTETLMLIRLHVEEALILWEPRIKILSIDTDPDPILGRVNILVSYRIKDRPDPASMVFPFYLLPKAE